MANFKIIALRPEGGLGNPAKILQILKDPQKTRREVQSCKFVVFRNPQGDLALVIGHGLHPLIAEKAKPHVGEDYKADSGGKITFHPMATDGWKAVLGGWSTTYEGPPTPELLYHTAAITNTLGMPMRFRWELERYPSVSEGFPVERFDADLRL